MIRNVTSPFTTKTLSFLRALKRNNRREWFQPRKDDYETHVRAPMVSLLERLAIDLRGFAPELIAEPKISLFRIYRDTRFSSDKRPYKTHVAARFPHAGALVRRDVAESACRLQGASVELGSLDIGELRLRALARRDRRSPRDWGGFVLLGDPTTRVSLGSPGPRAAAAHARAQGSRARD